MPFELDEGLEILERTPNTIRALLTGLSQAWLTSNEGPNSWNPSQVLDHLIELEKTDWIPRSEMILQGDSQPFPPVDRNAHLKLPERALEEKLLEFEKLRQQNIRKIKDLALTTNDFEKKGTHPDFGQVTLKELLSTWVVHDLTHLNQITRVMAKRYADEVGPWREYLGVLKRS